MGVGRWAPEGCFRPHLPTASCLAGSALPEGLACLAPSIFPARLGLGRGMSDQVSELAMDGTDWTPSLVNWWLKCAVKWLHSWGVWG